jgi:hypothetical protein
MKKFMLDKRTNFIVLTYSVASLCIFYIGYVICSFSLLLAITISAILSIIFSLVAHKIFHPQFSLSHYYIHSVAEGFIISAMIVLALLIVEMKITITMFSVCYFTMLLLGLLYHYLDDRHFYPNEKDETNKQQSQ